MPREWNGEFTRWPVSAETVFDAYGWQCMNGECIGTPKPCNSTPCALGVCNSTNGLCELQPKAEGDLCTLSDKCFVNATVTCRCVTDEGQSHRGRQCVSGQCTAGPAVDCDDGNSWYARLCSAAPSLDERRASAAPTTHATRWMARALVSTTTAILASWPILVCRRPCVSTAHAPASR